MLDAFHVTLSRYVVFFWNCPYIRQVCTHANGSAPPWRPTSSASWSRKTRATLNCSTIRTGWSYLSQIRMATSSLTLATDYGERREVIMQKIKMTVGTIAFFDFLDPFQGNTSFVISLTEDGGGSIYETLSQTKLSLFSYNKIYRYAISIHL